MSKVIPSGSVSLDGFIAFADDSVGPLFDWYGAGEVESANAGGFPPFRLTPESAEYWRWTKRIGAVVAGRRTFDFTDGWKGTHPFDVPVVILTHEAAPVARASARWTTWTRTRCSTCRCR